MKRQPVFKGFVVFDAKSGDLIGSHDDGFLFYLDLPEGSAHRDQWGRLVIPVYEEV